MLWLAIQTRLHCCKLVKRSLGGGGGADERQGLAIGAGLGKRGQARHLSGGEGVAEMSWLVLQGRLPWCVLARAWLVEEGGADVRHDQVIGAGLQSDEPERCLNSGEGGVYEIPWPVLLIGLQCCGLVTTAGLYCCEWERTLPSVEAEVSVRQWLGYLARLQCCGLVRGWLGGEGGKCESQWRLLTAELHLREVRLQRKLPCCGPGY